MLRIPSTAMRSLPLRLLLGATLVTAAACDSILGPRSIAGTYVLETLSGEPLPVVLPGDLEEPLTLVADTLVIDERRRGSWTRMMRRNVVAPALPTLLIRRGDFEVVVLGPDRLALRERLVCGPGALCAPHLLYPLDVEGSRIFVTTEEGVRRYRRAP